MTIYRGIAIVFSCVFASFLGGNLQAQSAKTSAKAARSAASSKTAHSSRSPLLRSLSLHDCIAQLIVVRGYGDYPPADNAEYRNFLRWVREDRIGGFIVAGRIRGGRVIQAQPFEMAVFINRMQRLARTPLLVASDFERGASMRVSETARFPSLMAFGAGHDLSATKQLGEATAREARALGVTWVFAPDADVNNNPDNPVINTRSYGEDPQAVAAGVSAFIEGAHSDPKNYVLLAAKHFPGHGDTAEDSHLQLAKIDQPRERIESVELVPFRAAIDHGVDSIMTGHLAVPAFEPQQIPATISRNVLTGLLRDEMGFKGIVVTDALEMQGVAALFSQGEIAVRAIEAGADVLLMPSDPEACIRALMAAVRSGRISRRRIDASASKVMAAKQRVGLFRSRFVNLDAIAAGIEDPRIDDLAQSVADRAVTLVKDDKHLFPMPAAPVPCLVVMDEGQFSPRGEILASALRRGVTTLKVYVANPAMPDDVLAAIAADTSHCGEIYVASFLSVSASTLALQAGLNTFVKTLVHGAVPVALISLDNPYLLREFPDAGSYAATFSYSNTSEIAAAKAILGEIPITGKMPVSIPGLAKIGVGLDVPARPKTASNGAE